MQAITASTILRRADQLSAPDAQDVTVSYPAWMNMYKSRPQHSSTLFDLEAMTAKRMELLASIDQLLESPQPKSFDAVLSEISNWLPQERRSRLASQSHCGAVLGSDTAATGDDGGNTAPHGRLFSAMRRSGSRGGWQGEAAAGQAYTVVFDAYEDLVSHLLCRYAFCMSERWRKWFVKTEEVLLRARMMLEIAKQPSTFVPQLMARNGLPCVPLVSSSVLDKHVQEYLDYRAQVGERGGESEGKAEYYYVVPLALATRLIKSRRVLCHAGQAILFRDQVQEVFVTVFRSQLNRGLHEAYLERMRLHSFADETEKETVVNMLDAFLEHFIQEPTSALQEGAEGSVRSGDVQRLALTHFPLCMRQIDLHLRRTGHLKHHGRFMYGLFLKSIGLSMEDAMALFATLMTEKGGGSVEAFAKTAYGYNVRHNYGMEGKKTSYSSASCATIMALPPVVDKHDCHGCPFRFCDEAALRRMLEQPQRNPASPDLPDVRPGLADIEEIMEDCKGRHYTRACYKYFIATHSGAQRDSLFRSPYEYYTVSRQLERPGGRGVSESDDTANKNIVTPGKRTLLTPTLKDDVIRSRNES